MPHALVILLPEVRAKKNLTIQTIHTKGIKDPWTAPMHAHRRILRKHGEEALPSIETTVDGTFFGGGEAMTVKLTPEGLSKELRLSIKNNIEKLRTNWRKYEHNAQGLYDEMISLPRTQRNKGSNFNHTFQVVRSVSKVPSSLCGGELPDGFTDQQLTGYFMDLIFSPKGSPFLPAVNAVVYGTRRADDMNPYRIVTHENGEISIESKIGEPEEEEEVSQEATILDFLINKGLDGIYKEVMFNAHFYNKYSHDLLANFQEVPVKIEINGVVVQKDALTDKMMRAIVLSIADAVGYDLVKILADYRLFFTGDTLDSEDEDEDEDDGGDGDEVACELDDGRAITATTLV